MLKIQTKNTTTPDLAKLTEAAKQFRKESQLKSGNGVVVEMIIDSVIAPKVPKGPYKLVGYMFGVRDLAQKPSEHYTVVDDTTVAFKLIESDKMRVAKKSLKDAKTDDDKASAKEEIKKIQENVIGHRTLSDGELVYMITFEKATVARLAGLSVVKCIGFEPEGRIWEDSVRSEYTCASLFPLDKDPMTLANVNQQALRVVDPENPKSVHYLLGFYDYDRENDSDGPVIHKRVTQSAPAEYVIKKDGEDPKMIMPLTLIQQQETGQNGSSEDFMASTTLWPETLEKGLGIPSVEMYTAIAPANPVPVFGTFQTNTERTIHGSNRLVLYPHGVRFYLRSYLLQQCPRVSFSYAKEALGLEPDCDDRHAVVQLDSPGNPCKLNQCNTAAIKKKIQLVNGMFACASFFTGNLSNLNDQGCQWRVMHSRESNAETRAAEAAMSTEDAEKMLANIPHKLIYAVMPFEEEEEEKEEAVAAEPIPKKARKTKAKDGKK